MTKAPTRKATCSWNICDLDLDYCYSDPLLYKRDDQDTADSDYSDDDFTIAKRAGREKRYFTIALGTFVYYAAGYPSIGKLFNPKKYGAALLTKAFRTRRSGFCAGSTLDILNLPKDPTQDQRENLETEHVFDKGLQGVLYEYMGNRELPGDRSANFPEIDPKFWPIFDEPNAKLGEMIQFGTDRKGKKPMSPAEQLSETFGSDRNPRPFMVVESAMNKAKKDIFLGDSPIADERLMKAAKRAVKADTDEEADKMLSLFQTVSGYSFVLDFTQANPGFKTFSAFEYIRNHEFLERFDGVVDDSFTAWSNIEQVTETYNLQNWYGRVLDAHFTYVLDRARRLARQSIRLARAPYVEAYEAGRSLATYDRVMAALDQFEDLISQIKMPDVTSENYKKRNPFNGEGPSGSNS